MKIIKRITAIVAFGFGALFILNPATDIQVGFGITLIALSILTLE